MDYLYTEWHYKPVGFISYGMASAGLRAAEQIKPVVSALKMTPVPEAVSIHLRQALDADGNLMPTDAMAESAHVMLDELCLMTDALVTVRATATALTAAQASPTTT